MTESWSALVHVNPASARGAQLTACAPVVPSWLSVTTMFFQLERRIDLLIDMQVESSLPPLTQAKYVEQAN